MKKSKFILGVALICSCLGLSSCGNEIKTTVETNVNTTKETEYIDEPGYVDGVKYTLSYNEDFYYVNDIAYKKEIHILGSYNGLPVKNVEIFYNDVVEKIVIEEGVTNLLRLHCYRLKSLTLPKTLESIDSGIFYLCPRLFEIINHSNIDFNDSDIQREFECNPLVVTDKEGLCHFVDENDFSFVYYDNKGYVLDYIGESENNSITIPSSFTYQGKAIPVKEIWNHAFDERFQNNKVTIQDGIEIIGERSFEGAKMNSIKIPDSIKKIKDFAFASSTIDFVYFPNKDIELGEYLFYNAYTLGEVNLPNCLKAIPKGMFYDSHLKHISIPNSVTKIEKMAFSNCNDLLMITIPKNVLSIEDAAFLGCDRLYEVYNLSKLDLSIGNENNGRVTYSAKKIYTNESESQRVVLGPFVFLVTSENTAILINYIGNDTHIEFPSSIEYQGKTISDYEIMEGLFKYNKEIKSVHIPGAVKRIGEKAFYDCNLEEVIIDEGLKSIGDYAFSRCWIENMTLPNTLESTGYDFISGNFLNCNSYGKGKYIGNEKNPYLVLVKMENDSYVEIHEDTKFIADEAFNYCYGLVSLVIPEGMKEIKDIQAPLLREIYNLSSLTINKDFYVNEHNYGYESIINPPLVVHTTMDEKSIILYENDFCFAYVNHKGYILDYLGENKEIVLPTSFTYDGLLVNVEEIVDYAFPFAQGPEYTGKKFIIPEGYKSIGLGVFYKSHTVILPNSIEQIGPNSFTYDNWGRIPYALQTDDAQYIGNEDNPYLCCFGRLGWDLVKVHDGTKIVLWPGYSTKAIIVPTSVKSIYNCPSKIYYGGTSLPSFEIDNEDAILYFFTASGEAEMRSGNYWYYDAQGNVIEVVNL